MDNNEAVKCIREIVGLPIIKKPPYFSHKEHLQIALYLMKQEKELQELKHKFTSMSKEGANEKRKRST